MARTDPEDGVRKGHETDMLLILVITGITQQDLC